MRLTFLLLLFPLVASGQPNCNVFLQNQDTLQYEACQFLESSKKYYQFDWRQLKIWEESISICPYFAYPYREIGAPFVKAGNFIEWKKNMDKAVEYAPLDYLSVRASLRYKFFADYEGAIKDINELSTMVGDVGYTSNGTYHLNVLKGLCLKGLGMESEAIKIMEAQMELKSHMLGVYDYLHLGVLYLNHGETKKAIECFDKQIEENDLAENRYYAALAFKKMNNLSQYQFNVQKSKEMFLDDRRMFDGYNELFDQIYLQDILLEIGFRE